VEIQTTSASCPQSPKDNGQEGPESGVFSLVVSENKIEAYLQPLREIPNTLTVDTVKEFLKKEGISYGLVDDRQIDAFLTQETLKGKPFLIANGRLPDPGKDAQIIYYFDKDPLKIGTIKEGGAIDFKEKGDISQVDEGTLLAEKIPLVKEEPGMDVYGKILPVPKAQDAAFLPRENTELSKDGLKVFAKKAGRPILSAEGKLSVSPEIEIKGDVGIETGHIQFNGFINIEGTIQEGYRVKGRRLAAKEICKAEVEIEGDIIIDGGIIGSKVVCKGNIKARYIQASTIEALGDVLVGEEVMHSKLDIHGALIAHSLSGKILSSQIIAGKGIETNIIGSDSSKPCSLMIGIDSGTKKFIDKLMEEIASKEEGQKKIKSQIDSFQDELNRLAKGIGDLAQIQDRGTLGMRALLKTKEGTKSNPSQLSLIENEIKSLREKIKTAEERLNLLMDQQDRTTEKILTLNQEMKESGKSIDELNQEIQAISEKLKSQKGNASVKVLRQIFSGTVIKGPHSSLTMGENCDRVLIRERQITDADGDGNQKISWEMAISNLT
jgi:uncharacterized protein (DUF342 family)